MSAVEACPGTALTIADLREVDGEARVHDLLLGERLGLAQPINIRKVIRKNEDELQGHGSIFSRREKFARTGPVSTAYYLNEAQALLVCMFARTPVAAEERRIADLERLLRAQAMAETPSYAAAITYAPAVFRLERPDGRLRGQRYPKFWGDLPVREGVIARHRQMTIATAAAELAAEFGAERAPSRSAVHRFWKMLDHLRGVRGSAH